MQCAGLLVLLGLAGRASGFAFAGSKLPLSRVAVSGCWTPTMMADGEAKTGVCKW